MATTVRTIRAEEGEAWLACPSVAFFRPQAPGGAERWFGGVDLERTWGAFEGRQVVGTLRSFATPLTVPGPAQQPAAAVTGVSVLPTHRRRGLLGEMLRSDLAASREREEPLAILVASEWPIYGRFGFGMATESASYRIDARAARFGATAPGSVELVEAAEVAELGPRLHAEHRGRRPGTIERPRRWWDRMLGVDPAPGGERSPSFHALYRDASGTPRGFCSWRASLGWDEFGVSWAGGGALTVVDLVATSDDAYAALWRFCCEVDLVSEVRAPARAVDETLPLLLADGRVVQQVERHDFLWVRPLDVAVALAGRRYAAPGRLVLRVEDPLGLSAGTFLLEADPGGATCCPTDQSPQITLGAGSLGSIYLGGVALRRLAGAARADEHQPGALDRADAMFHSAIAPWSDTEF